jgi:hypothetical protein
LANQYAVSFAALGGGDGPNDGAVVVARLEEDSLVRWHTDAATAGEGVHIAGIDAVSGATSVSRHFTTSLCGARIVPWRRASAAVWLGHLVEGDMPIRGDY